MIKTRSTKSCYVFLPFSTRFGGIERLILMLGKHEIFESVSLRMMCFNTEIEFETLSAGRIAIDRIECERNPVAEARAMKRFMRHMGIPSSRVLVLETVGALYASVAMRSGYSMHISDPPSLLPTDRTRHSFSYTRKRKPFQRVTRCHACVAEIKHQIVRRGVRKAAKLLTMTQRNREELEQLYGKNADVIYHGIELPEKMLVRSRSGDTPVRFLSVSRLERNKNLDTTIRAFGTLTRTGSLTPDSWHLTIVGEGSVRQELENLALAERVGKNVTFTGFLPDSRLEEAFSESDIFLMPARQGFGLPGMESLARGLLLVVNRDSGVSELYPSSPWVNLVTDLDHDLCEAIEKSVREIRSGEPSKWDPPRIISRTEWSNEILEACDWLP